MFDTVVIELTTGSREGVFDLTSHAAEFCRGRGDGLLSVFVPHATAGVAVIEVGAGSDDDLMAAIDDLFPADGGGDTLMGHPVMDVTTYCRPSYHPA